MNKEDYEHLKTLLNKIPDDDLARAIGGLVGKEIELNKRYREVVDSLLNPPKEISCDAGYVEYAMDILEELEESKNA